ncbi:phage tail assembly chaperone [Pseudotabrizicola sediminis]|uniref:Phage tail assembly chaperone n=1 Tax=Pseudotabrizicola sediminis TaxID=2486418 RepID=A0ABY2KRC6_9RHOB|nr:rcc01693 family protein [Pseudotabrizicola sediminis]TGD45290.1 phage tail assembly chaperone [Pseudotabrizicola sediminis]TGD63955.1 phage tail assembly chaperone [Tabrizicola sp. WMC-M-20]
MSGIDWPGLMRVGLHQLGLEPVVFWRLSPVELRIMLGADAAGPPLTRARLAELAAAFPDRVKEVEDGTDRRDAGADRGA